MARILFLTELLPYPLVSGAKIRIYYVLRYLADRHQVTLLSFVRPDDRPEDLTHLEAFLHRVETVPIRRSWLRDFWAAVVSLFTGRPAIIVREEMEAMLRKVEQLLASEQFEAIHADQIPMAQYGLIGGPRRVKRLLDQHNATFQILQRLAAHERSWWKRLVLEREARAFARYEVEVCERYDYVTFVTEEDRQKLLAQMPDGSLAERSTVIPICVDTEAVPPMTPVPAPFRITHVGTMYWPPNVEGILWLWEEVWPLVRAQAPEARLTLIGKKPAERIRELDGEPDVEVVGYVEDLLPYLAETAVFVVPLRAAGGMRVKILDAWCWGLPIVSTTIGAEGIALGEGETLLIADTPDRYARAIVRVLHDVDLQRRLRASGRQWVEARYDWRRVYQAWDEVYGRLVDGRVALPS